MKTIKRIGPELEACDRLFVISIITNFLVDFYTLFTSNKIRTDDFKPIIS